VTSGEKQAKPEDRRVTSDEKEAKPKGGKAGRARACLDHGQSLP